MDSARNFILLLASLLLAAGVPLLAAGTQVETESRGTLIAGEVWKRGDGLGYNVLLNLGSNGRYRARWTRCLGEYGWSEGTWSQNDDEVALTPSHEEGMMRGHLRHLQRVERNGLVGLVPSDEPGDVRRFVNKEGSDSFYAFTFSEKVE